MVEPKKDKPKAKVRMMYKPPGKPPVEIQPEQLLNHVFSISHVYFEVKVPAE